MKSRKIYLSALLSLGAFSGGIPASAAPALPQDFQATFQSLDTAYAAKDIEGILRHYAPDCTFILTTPELILPSQDAKKKTVQSKIRATRTRHDIAWQRQELQRLFFVTRQPLEKSAALPLQRVSMTSRIEKSGLTRQATELRLTVARTLTLRQGQVVGVCPEVDEELWRKGAQGWKLQRRTIIQRVGWTDISW